MNIFWLDTNFKKSAQYHCDKHVVKMIIEYAQILSVANREFGLDEGYNVTHRNHPCMMWARESQANWLALKIMALQLNKEYEYRYGRTHKSAYVIASLSMPPIPNIGITKVPQCVPEQYKCDNPIIAYRNYYIGEKAYFARWKGRPVPEWFNYNGILLPNNS